MFSPHLTLHLYKAIWSPKLIEITGVNDLCNCKSRTRVEGCTFNTNEFEIFFFIHQTDCTDQFIAIEDMLLKKWHMKIKRRRIETISK